MAAIAPEWALDQGRIGLRAGNGGLIDVSAADVVGAEFKGRNVVRGHPVAQKPSESISGIEFNRFPLEPWIVLRAPSADRRALCRIALRSRDGGVDVDAAEHKGDQIVVGNEWYPIADGVKAEIDALLAEVGAASGSITLRQYLHLARTGSPRILLEEEADEASPSVEAEPEPSGVFKGTLYPYQATGVRWISMLAREELGGILGDEMGLGKTIQVIAAIATRPKARPNLVVAPATLLENWRREIAKFAPGLKAVVHGGSRRTGFPSALREQDVVVTSYDTAVRDLGLLKMVSWYFVVLDEAQAIKNSDTLRSRTMRDIPKHAGLAVTGTPVENRLEDLWSILDFSSPGVLGPLSSFRNRFENTISGAVALQPAVSPLILRRRVAEVANDLPERIDIPVAIEMPGVEATEYERIRQETLNHYGKTAALVALTKLREFCTHPFILQPLDDDPAFSSAKYVRLIEILDEIFAAREKVIVFTSFQRMLDILVHDIQRRFGIPVFWIDGRTLVGDRQATVDRFSDTLGPALIALNPRAAGTGLNIVAANHVIHYNLEWNPAVEDQGSARAHRRGQRRPVTVHRLFYAATVEEIIDQRVTHKRQLADAAVVGTDGEDDLADIAAALQVSPVSEVES
jgi:SNF2 family DNA or RNA helicase